MPKNDCRNHVYMTITDLDSKIYYNQTCCSHITSNRGNCCVVIFYAVDGNYIKAYPIKSHHHSQLLKAYDDVYAFLQMQGYQPQLHKMYNENFKDVENFIAEQQAKVHYTRDNIHRTNISEAMMSHMEETFHGCEGRRTSFFLYGKLV